MKHFDQYTGHFAERDTLSSFTGLSSRCVSASLTQELQLSFCFLNAGGSGTSKPSAVLTSLGSSHGLSIMADKIKHKTVLNTKT